MGGLYFFLFPWNFIIQGIAIVHFIRRRPDTFWLWIILIGGGVGGPGFIAVGGGPGARFFRPSFKGFSPRQRNPEIGYALLGNSSPGKYEKNADFFFLEGQVAPG